MKYFPLFASLFMCTALVGMVRLEERPSGRVLVIGRPERKAAAAPQPTVITNAALTSIPGDTLVFRF